MKAHPLRALIASLVVVYGLVLATVLTGNTPELGLDLQGGISVNLQPVKDGEVTDDVTDEQLDQAIEIIRKRVDALGVAEPEVARQGNTITVQLPGAKDQQEVLEVVGKTAQLEFRPVLSIAGQTLEGDERDEAEAKVEELRSDLGVPEGVTAQQVAEDEQAKQAATTTTTTSTTTTVAPAEGDATTTTTTTPPPVLNQFGVDTNDESFFELFQLEGQLAAELTPAEEQTPEGQVTLASEDGTIYTLGPVALTGSAVEGATAGLSGTEWTVGPVLKGGEDGIDKFNAIASTCYNATADVCPGLGSDDQGNPRGLLGIVLDDVVLSAPSINVPSFERDQIQISGSFDQESAEALAVALRFGSLPIELVPQQAETVSATLGEGALQAGIISGVVGLLIAALYLAIYYRLLALVAMGGLVVAASALYVIMAFIGATVTLAGVVGLVVSIGVTVDSAVVYFEAMKEQIRAGVTSRVAADRAFDIAWGTIVKANVASLIGAGILYWLAIGPVRGFAFYLGAMTILDMVFLYLFVYPCTALLARSGQGRHPGRFGMAAPSVPTPPTEAPVTEGASS
jgi:preprotein translocase subunit SecD